MDELIDNEVKSYSRTQQHTLIMQCIYQYLFYLDMQSHPSIKEILQNVTKQPLDLCDKFVKNTFVLSIKHCQEAVDKLSVHLVDWEFSRLCYVDQAILILGYIEMFYASVPAPIVINTCIKMAQKYSSFESHRYINGVLDKIKDGI